MRRIRKVTIAVSEDFYNLLEKERNKESIKYNKFVGGNRTISFPVITQIIATRANNLFYNVKQKRRRI